MSDHNTFNAKLFRKKPVALSPESFGLKRCLGLWDLTLLGIGAIIGTGIFVLTGIAAATTAGPAVILSFVIAGIACTFAALAYAELSASVGGSGSAYGYAYAAFGELTAWIIGWILILEYGVATAAVANGWSGYFNSGLGLFGLSLPDYLIKGPFAGGIINLPAFTIIMVLMGLLVAGIKQSAALNMAMVFIKILVIVVFIAVGVSHVNSDNWIPFMPYGWFSSVEGGNPVGILAGASVVFFAYVGFDAVSTATEEAKNPQRDIPLGILFSLIFCTLIYIVVSGVLTGIVSYKELNVASPVAHALELVGIKLASAIVSAGVIAGLTTVMLVLYYALTRILTAMARDGLISSVFGDVNSTTQTPVKNTVICGTIMALMAGLVPLKQLAELVNIGTLSAFVLVCIGVIVMRASHPDLPRPFKIPGGMLVSVLGVLSCLALIGFLPPQTHLRFLGWVAAGLVIYFAYGIYHSRLNK
jgi:basic amino acid/polyamine antiporter, APA family